MYLVFPKQDGDQLFIKITEYVRDCLAGEYSIRKYFTKRGELLKEELIWENGKYKSTQFYRGITIV